MSCDKTEHGGLILVGTPIGNLSDFSPRAIQALKEADLIAAEDTRVTLKLLNHFEIKKTLVSYFEHNKHDRGQELLEKMQSGTKLVLVSDAGMPAISDPGEDLVRSCHERGIPVTVVPGPTAVATAVALSGFSTGRFCFEGFLSVNKKSRKEHLESLINESRTIVFYEAPHKLRYTLRDLRDTLGGNRRIALIKELTKIHEKVEISTLQEATDQAYEHDPKGEYVLVIEGAPRKETSETFSIEDAVLLAKKFQEEGDSLSVAAKKAAAESGLAKNEIYKRLVEN
ncbi:MAG: 16S rRNA (cytidine(1402)-2'-O)-methyltransferase [Clostridia bacterium]|nr:16S rRNA (cytidine(1402)-2'-O)-methyltransferase [Clostridia bacterium]